LILAGDPFTRQGGDWIHLDCWRVGRTVGIADMIDRARRLVQYARRRLWGTPIFPSA
jgi:hypothetical protein